jgi:hypothetical protein
MREARLATKERELVERQKVLTEQYRLLKSRESQAAKTAAAKTAWPPPRSPQPVRQELTFWARVRRAMLGLGLTRPLYED